MSVFRVEGVFMTFLGQSSKSKRKNKKASALLGM